MRKIWKKKDFRATSGIPTEWSGIKNPAQQLWSLIWFQVTEVFRVEDVKADIKAYNKKMPRDQENWIFSLGTGLTFQCGQVNILVKESPLDRGLP